MMSKTFSANLIDRRSLRRRLDVQTSKSLNQLCVRLYFVTCASTRARKLLSAAGLRRKEEARENRFRNWHAGASGAIRRFSNDSGSPTWQRKLRRLTDLS